MDRIDRIRIFTRVFECASFTDAANSLHIPRSTASIAVQELEARVGVQLFHRTTRCVTPTHDGTVFYDHALRLLADVEDTETLFHFGAKPKGHLRIDAPSRIARRVISPALPDFLAQYPEIDLEFGGTDRQINLVREGVDCVIRVGDVSGTGLNVRHIGEIDLINCASPDYLARYGRPKTIADLRQHYIVKFASSNRFPADDWEYMSSGEVHTVEMPARICTNDAETYIACCIAGLGLIQIPSFDVQEELNQGVLVEVLPEWRASSMPLNLLWPHQSTPTRRVKVFLDWVSGLLDREVLQQTT